MSHHDHDIKDLKGYMKDLKHHMKDLKHHSKDIRKSVKNNANIVMGKAKIAAGNFMGDEELSLKGKLQTAKGTIGEKTGLRPRTIVISLIGATAILFLATRFASSSDNS